MCGRDAATSAGASSQHVQTAGQLPVDFNVELGSTDDPGKLTLRRGSNPLILCAIPTIMCSMSRHRPHATGKFNRIPKRSLVRERSKTAGSSRGLQAASRVSRAIPCDQSLPSSALGVVRGAHQETSESKQRALFGSPPHSTKPCDPHRQTTVELRQATRLCPDPWC